MPGDSVYNIVMSIRNLVISCTLSCTLAPKNRVKKGYFSSFSGKSFPHQGEEKCPKHVFSTHLGHFTKVETEGLEPATSRM